MILLAIGRIKLHNVILPPNYNSNLISLGKLRKSRITYQDRPKAIKLMRKGKIIAYTKKEQNLFILDLAEPRETMAITGWRRLIHLVRQNKYIQFWH